MDLYKEVIVNAICSEEDSIGGITSTALCSTQDRSSWSALDTHVKQTADKLMQLHAWDQNENKEAVNIKNFISVMLQAWRQRRLELNHLHHTIERLEKHSINSKNELHVTKTLMRVEQRRCKELQTQLKESTLSINNMRTSCEKVTKSFQNCTVQVEKLEVELRYREKQYEDMKKKAEQSKENFLNSLMEQRCLQDRVSKEQCNVEQLTREKEQLLDEIINMRSLTIELQRKENIHIMEFDQKNEIANLHLTVNNLERGRRVRSLKDDELRAFMDSETSDIELHRIRALIPKQQSESSLDLLKSLKEHKVSIAAAIGHNVKLTPKTTNFLKEQTQSKKSYLVKLAQALSNLTSNAAYFLWLCLLPNSSVRYGCMSAKKRVSRIIV